MTTIRAVLFDAGGVLVLPDPETLRERLARFGASEDLALYERAHFAGQRAMHLEATERDNWRTYDRGFAAAVGVPADCVSAAAETLRRAYVPRLWRFPRADALSALSRLMAAGVPVGVVSNAEGQIEEVLAEVGLGRVGAPFVCVVDSFVVGVSKPDPAIFEHALPHFGAIQRAEIAYVGDSVRNDVVGAKAAGLTPLHLDPHDDFPDVTHARIASINELVDRILR